MTVSPRGSYNHWVRSPDADQAYWTCGWMLDYPWPVGPHTWNPRSFHRRTTEAGARRFCRLHGLQFPPVPPPLEDSGAT